MFPWLIRQFLEKENFTNVLSVFIIIAGISAYLSLPREKFPTAELDRIIVSGGYAKTSNEILDQMIVRDIENEIRSIEGIHEIRTTISNGSFTISSEINENYDNRVVADKLRDAISKASNNLPSDMVLPTVRIAQHSTKVIQVALRIDEVNSQTLQTIDEIRDRMNSINGIENISVSGDNKLELKIFVDKKLLELYGIDIKDFGTSMRNLSNIFPVGEIGDSKYSFFLTTEGGKKRVSEIEDTILKFNNISLKIKDVAKIKISEEDSSKISSVNSKRAVIFTISKTQNGNAIEVAKNIKEFVKNYNQKIGETKLISILDESYSIRERLNNVISNIILSIIIVFISMWLLINLKIAFIVAIGVPTSFLIAFIYFQYFGYSLNLISLLALLIALGILVDDAIIVSENIQRHIDEGATPEIGAYFGTIEVIQPVTLALLTNILAFLPLLYLSGTMGMLMGMIPIGVTVLVIASYFESFLFLPLHARVLLKRGDKTTNWEKSKNIYKNILSFLINYKKIFLILFIFGVPIATYFAISSIKFQLFPKIDNPVIYISGKLDSNSKLLESEKIANQIAENIFNHKNELGIKNIISTIGMTQTPFGETEKGEHFFSFQLELYEESATNFIDKYITPNLSFEYDGSEKIRDTASQEIINKLNKELENYKKEYKISELAIYQKRMGSKVDIEIAILSNNGDILKVINNLSEEIIKINGVSSISNNGKIGTDQMTLKINKYGESLGLNETILSENLSNLYLLNKKGSFSYNKELLDIKIEDINKNNIQNLKNSQIKIGDKTVSLGDVVDFVLSKQLQTIDKYNFKEMKSIFINVDTKIITADEVLKKIEPHLKNLEQNGFQFELKGEKEKRDDMNRDLSKASIIALSLIFLTLLFALKNFTATFLIISVIPFSILGAIIGHFILDLNLTLPGLIGIFGLAGVVINDSIVMILFIHETKSENDLIEKASQRLRPIVLTSLTTLLGLSSLIFFVSGDGKILQPIAVSLGFGLLWGTIINLLYIPAIYSFKTKNI
jgi:multidrug efflux pump subunit AcrB